MNPNINEFVKTVMAVGTGIGLAYILNESGFTPWLNETYINMYGLFGKGSEDFVGFMYENFGKYSSHIGIASAGGLAAYLGLEKILK